MTSNTNIFEKMVVEVADVPELLKRVIRGDETWMYGYDTEINA